MENAARHRLLRRRHRHRRWLPRLQAETAAGNDVPLKGLEGIAPHLRD
ncbi:hypothetical protein [Novosphingobium sp. MBES04]|nr:hypothetical protein [Novosphingobium sp. MBES04]